MIEIKELLHRFDKILSKKKADHETILSTIFRVTGIKLTENSIKVFKNTLYIETQPIKKNEIFFKKSEILKELTEKNQKIFDLR